MKKRRRASLEEAERIAREIGERIKEGMPPGWGFILWLESFGEDGFATYLSTIERDTAIRSLQEWIARVKGEPPTNAFVDDTATTCWCCGEKEDLVVMRGPHRKIELCRLCLASVEPLR